MNNAVRAINLIVLAFVIFAASQATADNQGGAYSLGRWIGITFLLIAPVMTLLALRQGASSGLRRHAGRVNVGVLTLMGLSVGCTALTASNVNAIAAIVGVLMFSIPCLLNVWRLHAIDLEELETEPPRGWLVGRFWRGEITLGQTVWAGGAMLLIFMFFVVALNGVLMERVPLTVSARLMLGVFGFVTLCVLFQGVSVWRSASASARAGSNAWPVLAKLGVVAAFGAFGWFMWQQMYPQLREHALIAFGRDPLPPLEVEVTTNGTVLLLHGSFGTGSADKVRAVLAEQKDIKTVALSSPGGRLREADDIAQLVHDKELDTYVDRNCESACTYVFLAGADRAATPNARIGFHRPTFPGINPLGQRFALDRMLGTYRDAGIPQAFLAQVAATEPESMWYPTPEQLRKAGVINRVSLGGETAAIAALEGRSKSDMERSLRSVPMMVALERHFPGTIDEAARAAWVEHLKGNTDTAVNNAARNVIAERYPLILAAADDEHLDGFAEIMLEQMKAARSVSMEACHLLLQGRLNVEQVIPTELVQRELAWAAELLDVPKLQNRAPVDPAEFQEAMLTAIGDLSAETLDVVGNPEKYDAQPQLRCESTIALYERITAQPPAHRHLLLRGMFQAAES